MEQNLLFYIFIFLLLFVCLRIYYESDAFQLKCVIATKDGNRYCVRDRRQTELHLYVELLATVTGKCKDLVAYLGKKYPEDESVKRLIKGFDPTKLSETLPTSELTAYNENKGEKLAFCLNTTKTEDDIVDINLLTFVAFHELAHIMNEGQGHKTVYWEHFKFILENAKEANIHEPQDYKKKPEMYCGMKISDNPYYDLR
jgi:hypothetical protein